MSVLMMPNNMQYPSICKHVSVDDAQQNAVPLNMQTCQLRMPNKLQYTSAPVGFVWRVERQVGYMGGVKTCKAFHLVRKAAVLVASLQQLAPHRMEPLMMLMQQLPMLLPDLQPHHITCQLTQSFMYSFGCLFICLIHLIHSSVHSFTHPYMHSFVHSCLHSYIHVFIYSFTCSYSFF